EQLDDGRFLLTLEGVIRMRIAEELPEKDGYRRARADYADYAHDLDPPGGGGPVDREGLLAALRSYLSARGLSADQDAIGRLADEPLVNALAMACPFQPAEKQALLQAADVPARATLLDALLRMSATHEAANDDEPPRPN
ncbi:MAG: peptidase S16, partial [Alphaproteobacteria bacterium]